MSLPDASAAQAVLEDGVIRQAFPGAAWGVSQSGEIVETGVVGRLTYFSQSAPAREDTLYDLASITKVMSTTAIAMRLRQQRLFELDMPLVEILPEFGAENKRGQVTLRMLLDHSSGLQEYAELWQVAATPQQALDVCLRMPLLHAPGTHTAYSDIGFILLGAAIERIAGTPLRKLFAETIAAPLGLRDTHFGPLPQHLCTRTAPTTDIRWRKRELQGEVHDENCALLGGAAGHAGLFSTVADVLHFADAILRPDDYGLFTPECVRLFTTRASNPPGTSRALGWDTPSTPSQSGHRFAPHSVGHLGYAGTSLWLDLDRQLAVALLTNRVYTPDVSEPSKLISEVRPAFHDALLGCMPRNN